MSIICGSFKSQKEDDFEVLWPSPSKKTKRNRFCRKRYKEDYKNPYSNYGLDKFESLLAELDEKKREIFTQKGSQYISFVRFVYSNSENMKPIIVRLKGPRKHEKDNQKQNDIKDNKSSSPAMLHVPILNHHQNSELLDTINGTNVGIKEAHHAKASTSKVTNKIRHDQWKIYLQRKLEELWMPSYSLPLFVIFVMLSFTFFGRSLAIICASVAWYLIPNYKIGPALENTTTKKIIKNQHSIQPSENKVISSPKSFFSGPMNIKQNKRMQKLTSF